MAIFAGEVLTPGGWVKDARIVVEAGHIVDVAADAKPGADDERHAILVPGMSNVWQTTIKDTALVSVVGLQELMRAAFVGAGSTRHPFIFYFIAAVVYLVITLVSQGGFDRIERLLRPRTRK